MQGRCRARCPGRGLRRRSGDVAAGVEAVGVAVAAAAGWVGPGFATLVGFDPVGVAPGVVWAVGAAVAAGFVIVGVGCGV